MYISSIDLTWYTLLPIVRLQYERCTLARGAFVNRAVILSQFHKSSHVLQRYNSLESTLS